jgi:3-dehydroquinate synthase
VNWSTLDDLSPALGPDSLVVVDTRVLRLHPKLQTALHGHPVLGLRAGEGAKSLRTLERIGHAARHVTRRGRLVAIGGGTIGDVCTVAAHLIKRGIDLVHVPTTALAAVDSSLGGKGAVNLGGIKNALGVFHQPQQTHLIKSLFRTLSPTQHREGALEAWKMVVTLDAGTFKRWSQTEPDFSTLIQQARRLKADICRRDPFETKGLRVVLNFGHTFGHVLESATAFRMRHGDAVGLGMLCALDIGVALGVTPRAVAQRVESALPLMPRARQVLAMTFKRTSRSFIEGCLRSDKKRESIDPMMVLLEAPGRWRLAPVPPSTWQKAVRQWSRGEG